MPIPDLATYCVALNVTPQNLSVTFPGGASLSAQLPDLGFPDPMQLSKQLMAEANAALAPLTPVFNLIDVVLALYQAVKAIPDAISHLDPGKITDALPDVARKASKLLPLVPQLSVPLMVVGLIDTLLAFLGGLSAQLRALVDHQARIQRAADRAAQLGSAQLQVVVGCARDQVDAQMTSLAQSFGALNQLVALVNVSAELAGLPGIPALPELGADAADALQPLDDVVHLLQTFRAAIPVG
jgi:hypothetical protein